MNVALEQMPALRVAAVPHVGPYNRIAEAFERLVAIAVPAGLMRRGTMMVAVFYDNPRITPAERLHSDAGLTVPENVCLPAGVAERRLSAGRYARTTHVGTYATLGDTWSRMMDEWLPGSGNRIGSGPTYEVYRNNPSDTRPEELRTDLYIPIA